MRKADILSAIILLMFGLLMIFFIIPAQTTKGEEFGVPPATMPMVAMGIVVVLSMVLLFEKLKSQPKENDKSPIGVDNFLYIFLYAIILCLGVAALKFLHFIPAGILIIGVIMVLNGQRKPIVVGLTSVTVTLIIYAALWYGLRIPLP